MNPNKNILPQKNLEHSKNIDVDTLFLEMENQTLAEARIKSKSCYQSPNFSPLIDNPRDPDHFDNVVITRLKSESLESFLSSYSIKGSTLGSLSLLIGKVVYSFKVYNSQTSFTWPLKKTITEFDKLFKQLKKYLCKEKIIKSINVKCIDFLGVNGDRKIVAFDYTFCKKTEESKSHDILVYLEEFLNTLLEYREIRKTSLLLDFLEVSCIYYPSSSKKYKECYLKKKPGGRFRQGCGTTFCNAIFSLWITRWFMISEDGIKYCTGPSKDKCMIKEMLLFDNSFKLEYGFKQTGSVFGINLITTSRKLVLKTTSLWELYDLIGSIEDAIKNCAYIQENRFCSFAPQRNQLTYCKAFVDGEGYYSDLFEALKSAQKEVFITDWWLSPELYLKRPVNNNGLNQDSRLDRVLYSLAIKGVKIFIIVYREVSFVLPLDSNHTKTHLEKLSPNIKVLQHPADLICWWSHHEKLVIIDQEIAFLGGLDLCFGRMDTQEHKLLDPEGPNGEVFWPGIDYSNCRVADFRNVKNFEKPLIERNTPRMPWHDIGMKVFGIIVKDLARHFIQYWNYAKVDLAEKRQRNIDVKNNKNKKSISAPKNISSNIQTNKTRNEKVIEVNQILGNSKFAKKKHKATFDQPIPKDDRDEADWNIHYEELKIPIDLHIKNFTNPNLIPQLDFIHKSYSSDQKSPVNQLKKSWKKAYTERSKAETSPKSNSKFLKSQTLKASPLEDFKELYENMDKKREDIEDYDNNFSVYKYKIEQMKKPAEDLNIDTREVVNDHFYEQNMLQLNYEKPKQNQKLQYDMKPSCKCQIVRSVSNWSCGLDNNRYENSIQFAYLQLIEDSQFYIYIENQFFISSLAGPAVENSVVKALLYRIRKAHKNKETFKVYVVMPLLPGFEGDIADKVSAVMRIQLHWEYYTISRSETSLITSLEKDGIDPEDYLMFLGLRNHTKSKKPMTEIVYVHSKMMIIDDRIVIMGSANINDRSMNGNRDSEIGIVVEDTTKIDSLMGKNDFAASKFALELRLEIWKEIFGFDSQDMVDPIEKELWNRIRERAKKNSEIYRIVFACYPDNSIKKLCELDLFYKTAQPELYDLLKDNIKGFVVEFPYDFLKNENLKFSQLQREYYAPEYNFT